MPPAITSQDLDRLADRIEERLVERTDRIEKRLDVLNGKTITHGEELARQGARLTSVEKEVFERPYRRRDDVPIVRTDPDADLITLPISKKQIAGLVGVGTVIGAALVRLLPLLAGKL